MKALPTIDFPSVVFLLSIVLILAQPASSQSFSTNSGRIEFQSRVPLHSFSGVSEELTGRIDFETGTVDFYVDLETLKTGIGKRDKDMRKTLETSEYPFAEFYGQLSGFRADVLEDQQVSVEGMFKLHGIERRVTVEGTLAQSSDKVTVTAEWTLSLGDYNISPPRLLVVRVDPVQKIVLHAVLLPE